MKGLTVAEFISSLAFKIASKIDILNNAMTHTFRLTISNLEHFLRIEYLFHLEWNDWVGEGGRGWLVRTGQVFDT